MVVRDAAGGASCRALSEAVLLGRLSLAVCFGGASVEDLPGSFARPERVRIPKLLFRVDMMITMGRICQLDLIRLRA